MKAIRMITILFAFFLMGLLFTSGSYASIGADQLVNRPNVIYREHSRLFHNTLLKGNTSSSPVELLLNTVTLTAAGKIIRGDLNVTRDANSVNVTGSASATHHVVSIKTISGIQNNTYLPKLPVDKRFHLRLANIDRSSISITSINQTLSSNATYTGLMNNQNYTTVTRDAADLTAFIYHSGRIGTTTINDTDGNPLVTVVGFITYMRIYIFQTSNQQLVAVADHVNKGYGNIFPSNIISYLSNQTYVKQVGDNTEGSGQLNGGQHISWFYRGYNDSMGLDIYSASFSLAQHSRAILFRPTTNATLTINSVSAGLETFMNDLETSNSLSVDNSTVDSFDTQVVDQAVTQEGASSIEQTTSTMPSSATSTLPEVNDSTSLQTLAFNSYLLIFSQILALVIIGNITLRKYRK